MCYTGITNRNFNTRYKENISKLNLNENNPNSNFAKHVLKNKHNVSFKIDKNLDISHSPNKIYKNNDLGKMLIFDEIK